MGRTSDFLPAALVLYEVLLDDSEAHPAFRIITDEDTFAIVLQALLSTLEVCFLLKKKNLPWWMVDPTPDSVRETGVTLAEARDKCLQARIDRSVNSV